MQVGEAAGLAQVGGYMPKRVAVVHPSHGRVVGQRREGPQIVLRDPAVGQSGLAPQHLGPRPGSVARVGRQRPGEELAEARV